jgi:hypothetical protein
MLLDTHSLRYTDKYLDLMLEVPGRVDTVENDTRNGDVSLPISRMTITFVRYAKKRHNMRVPRRALAIIHSVIPLNIHDSPIS